MAYPFSKEAQESPLKPIAGSHEAITVSTTAETLTPPGGAAIAVLTVEGTTDEGIRWRDDGTAVTATTGHFLVVGSLPMVVAGHDQMTGLSLIRDTDNAADCTVRVSYYK